SSAYGSLEHDRQGTDDPLGAARICGFPGPLSPRYAQMRNRIPDEPGLWLRAAAGRAFVANFAAGPCCRTRKRRDRGRMIVGLALDHTVHQCPMRAIDVFAIGMELLDDAALHDRGVIAVGDDRPLRMRSVGVP